LEITAVMVKELRQATGAGVLDCRKALEDSGGDVEGAVAYLREKGLAAAAKRAGRQASDGRVEAYVHPGNRVAVLLELNCETDFVRMTLKPWLTTWCYTSPLLRHVISLVKMCPRR
jgi:elongation factor Ts